MSRLSRKLKCSTADFDCPICMDNYACEGPKTPHVLDCGHTLCNKCIETIMRRSPKKCPSCSDPITKFPPKNFFAIEALSVLATKRRRVGAYNLKNDNDDGEDDIGSTDETDEDLVDMIFHNGIWREVFQCSNGGHYFYVTPRARRNKSKTYVRESHKIENHPREKLGSSLPTESQEQTQRQQVQVPRRSAPNPDGQSSRLQQTVPGNPTQQFVTTIGTITRVIETVVHEERERRDREIQEAHEDITQRLLADQQRLDQERREREWVAFNALQESQRRFHESQRQIIQSQIASQQRLQVSIQQFQQLAPIYSHPWQQLTAPYIQQAYQYPAMPQLVYTTPFQQPPQQPMQAYQVYYY